MFDECIRNKQRELAGLHKISQQESALRSERSWIKHACLNVHLCVLNGKTSGVQSIESDRPAEACSAERLSAVVPQLCRPGSSNFQLSLKRKQLCCGELLMAEARAARQFAWSLESASTNSSTAPLEFRIPRFLAAGIPE